MTHRIALILSLTLALAWGCAADTPGTAAGPEGVDRLASERERIADPAVSAEARAALIGDNSAFAIDLYRQVEADAPGNLFFSPHSISVALAMTYAGAEGETKREMAEVLRFTLDDGELHPAFNELDAALASRRTRLDVINAAWTQPGYRFQPSYLDVLAEHYGAGIYLLDFTADPEAARAVVNAWVSDQTEDRIPELIGEDILSPMTRLVLTNAIYFNASWKFEFDEAETVTADFMLDDGSVVAADMMRQRADLRVAEGTGWQAVEIPYADDEMAMIAILPGAGLDELEAALTPALLDEALAGLTDETIDLSFPRFTFSSEFPLGQALQDMGMETAFDEATADFSRMDGVGLLYISAALHQAFVEVNERGTEAAAATAVVMDERSAGPRAISFDRPFLFLIRDLDTGAVLFLGRVVDPTAGE